MTGGGNTRRVDVPENVDVYVLYTTATVENDLVLFFEDIYGHDARAGTRAGEPLY